MLTFILNYLLWGVNGYAYQITTLALFVIFLASFYLLLRRLDTNIFVATAVTLMASVAPTSILAGAANVERSNSLIGIGMVLTLHVLLSPYREIHVKRLDIRVLALVSAGAIIAITAKESGLVAIASIAFGVVSLRWLLPSPSTIRAKKSERSLLVIFLAIAFAYIALRIGLGITEFSASDSLGFASRISNLKTGIVQPFIPLFTDSGDVQYIGRSLIAQIVLGLTAIGLVLATLSKMSRSEFRTFIQSDTSRSLVLISMIVMIPLTAVSLSGLDYYSHRLVFLGTVGWLAVGALVIGSKAQNKRWVTVMFVIVAFGIFAIWSRDTVSQISTWDSQRIKRVELDDSRIPQSIVDQVRSRYDFIEPN